MSASHHGQKPARDADPAVAKGSEDPLDAALEALRRRRLDPPSDMVDRAVLKAVQARATFIERERSSVRRFVKPAALFGLLALSGMGALLLAHRAVDATSGTALIPDAAPQPDQSPEGSVEEAADFVPVRFVLPAAGARQVSVAGEFNGWDASHTPLSDDDGDGVFHTTVSLERGAYAYMFVVDGERWVTDPFADAYRDDGFGNRNAVVRIP